MRPFLKNSILAALLVAATCAAAQPAEGVSASEEPSAREATDRRIARLDEAIRQVELTRNRLMWNTYLDYAEQGRITPDVMDYPGLDYERLRDTVPAIDTLGCRYTAAAEAYTEVLRTDPEYEAIHQEYVALKGVSDRDRQAENRMRYNLLYDRLRRNNPDYVPAWERMNEAKRQRNMAVLRYLVESHAGSSGKFRWCTPCCGTVARRSHGSTWSLTRSAACAGSFGKRRCASGTACRSRDGRSL